ncbi:MAG: bifunctional phosphopantothenoylcysteine decarboxylase/phosphopantothenate--cysteine ligase CoaBC [Christensenellales bacterium]
MTEKNVVLGVTGSIAAYKACDIVSRLRKQGVDVHVILTRAGAEIVTPLALETMSANPVVVDMFHRENPWEVEHISLAKRADVFLVAPATANFLGKAAHGIADDMLTTTILATRAPVLVAPAMNVNMYENPVVQENIALLKKRGWHFIEPDAGLLACGDVGKGRLAEPEAIVAAAMELLYPRRDLAGKHVLVSAGPTQERIDPVRYITNRSSGKMGYAIAEAAAARGARVTLISGPVTLPVPEGVERVNVISSQDMFEAVHAAFDSCDGLIMAAAPADFTPATFAEQKIKKNGREGMTLELAATRDILKSIGERKQHQRVMGFAAETEHLAENAAKKLEAKNLDMIAANDVTAAGAGFAVDTNAVTLYKRDGSSEQSGTMPKRALADWLLDRLFEK